MAKGTVLIIDRLIRIAGFWLNGKTNYNSPVVRCGDRGLKSPVYTIIITRLAKDLILIQEDIISPAGIHRVFRSWTFRKEKKWEVSSLEKNGKQVYINNLYEEAKDLEKRFDILLKIKSPPGLYYYDEITCSPKEMEDLYPVNAITLKNRIAHWLNRRLLRPAFIFPILLIACITLAIFASNYFIRVSSIKASVNEQMKVLNTFLVGAENEISSIKDKILTDKKTFEFNKKNAVMNILRLKEELAYFLSARKEAYTLIAENVEEAVSYGEIIYEMSRLPSEEYQARIFLAMDPKKIKPLGTLQPKFSCMIYPVCIPGRQIDGMGFRITDGYMDKREDPIGSGGTSPHYAVDIVNVSNVSAISYAGEIIREGFPPGYVTSTYKGTIIDKGFDNSYGWYLEIEHPMHKDILEKYPNSEGWSTYYAHLAEEPRLEIGESVKTGEILGDIGDTGKATGPHLHFELRIYHPRGQYYRNGILYNKLNPF
jgi:murein DD-endopeptidase MepM/ murein hydrolase activator NlpD